MSVQAKHDLTLKGDLKNKRGLRELIWSNPVFGKEKVEKRERELGLGRTSSLGVIPSHFLLLRDQATYKRRFERFEVRK